MTSQSGPPIGTSPGTVPILLLPVRIETRYVPRTGGGMNLRVRVYPDELHIDTHEPALMAAERAAGQAFHATPAVDHGPTTKARASPSRLMKTMCQQHSAGRTVDPSHSVRP